jgi:hypothetical protein
MKIFIATTYLFTVVGVSLLLSAVSDYNRTSSLLDEALSAEGTVVDLQETHRGGSVMYKPVIRFVDKFGEVVEFTFSVSSNPLPYARDEKVEILYSANDSQNVIIDSFVEKWGGAIVTAIIGIYFFSVGVIIFVIGILKIRKKDYLQRYSVAVNAKVQSVQSVQFVQFVQSVQPKHSFSVNGRNPFVIVCHWMSPATKCVDIFESNNIWSDPSDYMDTEEIKVFMNKYNAKKYYVDISFLPQVAR